MPPKKCQWKENGEICTKYARRDKGGKPEFCKKHGGGVRCEKPECPSSAQGDGKGGKPEFCVKHGGGHRCQDPERTSGG